MSDVEDLAAKVFEKLDALKDGLNEIKVELAKTSDHAKRIEGLEGKVSSLEKDRAKLVAVVAVVAALVPQLGGLVRGLF